MKLLNLNLKKFNYCLFKGFETIYDANGHQIGTKPVYGESVALKGNISAATGTIQTEMFGNADFYSKVIIVDDLNCPINEDSVLFVDKEPEFAEDGVTPLYDYVVKRVAEYLNVKAYAIDKVKVG